MKEITIISTMILAMIYNFTAHTINCVCHIIRSMFRVLGLYNIGLNLNKQLTLTIYVLSWIHYQRLNYVGFVIDSLYHTV